MIPPTGHHQARIDGRALELLVVDWLEESGSQLEGLRIEHRELITVADGSYQIDVTARFRLLGLDFLVLVECKDHARPVEREDVQVLADKKRAAGAQKALLVATNGFQQGAIEYARVHGIALVRIIEGAFMYETRSAFQSSQPPTPPPWANTQAFVGQRIYRDDRALHVWRVERGMPDALVDYLKST
jgi:restriction system protein